MNSVPRTPVKPKEDKIENLIDQLCGYAELVSCAAKHLTKHNRLAPQRAFQFQTELKLISNILKNMLGLPLSVYQEKCKALHDDPEFDKEVIEFANFVAPEKPILITPEDAMREAMAMKKTGVAPWKLT